MCLGREGHRSEADCPCLPFVIFALLPHLTPRTLFLPEPHLENHVSYQCLHYA